MTPGRPSRSRPAGIAALAGFFTAGAGLSLLAALSLATPGGPLEPMWRLKPRAREAFASMDGAAILLMAAVSAACALSAVGLWAGKSWGRRLAIGVLAANAIGDAANAIFGVEPWAAIGLPITGALILYLASRRAGRFFEADAVPGKGL
ncbi:MAG TPA: hypothetical protein VIA45_03775 [Thermoanaerobaculia bacterium]